MIVPTTLAKCSIVVWQELISTGRLRKVHPKVHLTWVRRGSGKCPLPRPQMNKLALEL